jgi:hypothetical protein
LQNFQVKMVQFRKVLRKLANKIRLETNFQEKIQDFFCLGTFINPNLFSFTLFISFVLISHRYAFPPYYSILIYQSWYVWYY